MPPFENLSFGEGFTELGENAHVMDILTLVDEIIGDRLELDPFAGVVIPANPTESLLKLSCGREGLRYDKINSLCFSSVIDRAHEFFLGGQQDRIATICFLFKLTEDIQYFAILIELTTGQLLL